MTEEIIKSITEAEKQAAECKRLAVEKAACILAEAEEKAVRLETTSVDVCKAYKETQTKIAMEDAERAYQETLEKKRSEAKEYCENALKNSEEAVSKIIGRIISGCC